MNVSYSSNDSYQYKKMAWMRTLKVIFSSEILKSSMSFGTIEGKDYNIEIDGYKYMSALKDSCTIKISNLTYGDIVNLISGQYYDVEVICGYKNGEEFSIFKGGVLYISNNLNDRKTNVVTVLCASRLVAQFGQKRMNLSLNSGINLYSALKFICDRAGITDSNISPQLKTKFLQEISTVNTTPGMWFETLADSNESLIINTDDTQNATISIFDVSKGLNRVVNLSEKAIDLTNGYPRLNSSGLTISLLPTFNFVCGDVIKIDNSLINIYVSSKDEANKNYGYYLDKDGNYLVYQIEYHLQNRGSPFSMELQARSVSLIQNIVNI